MHISQKQLEAYDKALSTEQEKALKLFEELYKQGKVLEPNLDVAGLRELAITSIHESLEVFGGAASELALEFVENTTGTDTTDFEYHELDDETKHRISRYVHGKAQHLVDGDEDSFVELCKQLLETEVHESANRTMRKAAGKLGLRYARVPIGGETCEFCLMLASRGFVYTSKESAGDGAHYHTHCRCKIIAGKKGDKVDGYDPTALYRQWKNGATTKQDSMLRKDADPAKKYCGSAEISNPIELEKIKRELLEAGVDISIRAEGSGSMGYSPSLSSPIGRLIAEENMSYSAWIHEYQHFIDCVKQNVNLKDCIINQELRIELEKRAYGKEIELARNTGNKTLANELLRLRNQEIKIIRKGRG